MAVLVVAENTVLAAKNLMFPDEPAETILKLSLSPAATESVLVVSRMIPVVEAGNVTVMFPSAAFFRTVIVVLPLTEFVCTFTQSLDRVPAVRYVTCMFASVAPIVASTEKRP